MNNSFEIFKQYDTSESGVGKGYPHSCDSAVGNHWLPVAARDLIQLKSLILTYRTTTGSAPAYLNAIFQRYLPSQPLHSPDDLLSLPSLCNNRSQSRLFLFMVPWWWNDLPSAVRSSDSLDTFMSNTYYLIFSQLFYFGQKHLINTLTITKQPYT